MKKAAILPAHGIGDALLMLICSYNLQEAGYEVITYQPLLNQLKPWLKNQNFGSFPHTYELEKFFKDFDLIILQNDNSTRAKYLISLREEGKLTNLSVFYPTYKVGKNKKLQQLDVVFDASLSMVDNISAATSKLLHHAGVSKNNGIIPLEHLVYRKEKKRVVIHPTSSDPNKNWPFHKFIALSKKLQKLGFQVVLALTENERELWKPHIPPTQLTPHISNLSDLASLIYESGFVIGNDSLIGHLGSNLLIPNLVIAKDPKHMQLWRPGWLKGDIITPSGFSSWICLKKTKSIWGALISVRQIIKKFIRLNKIYNNHSKNI